METKECLLCLRIPLERVRSSVEALLPHVDDAVIDRVAKRAAKLIATAYEKDRIALYGKKPSGLMAAAIYLSGRMEIGVKITQGMIAYKLRTTKPTLETTEVTISTRAHQINDLLGLGIMEHHKRPERLKLYVCPFCEKSYTSLTSLIWHLQGGGWQYSSKLRVKMFKSDGIMVDEDMLEKMKRYPGTCERPSYVEVIRGQGSRQSYFGQGVRLTPRGRYVVTG